VGWQARGRTLKRFICRPHHVGIANAIPNVGIGSQPQTTGFAPGSGSAYVTRTVGHFSNQERTEMQVDAGRRA